jgi:predicted nucleotidyltransferase
MKSRASYFKALDGSDAKLLKFLAGMRNILVQVYATVKRDFVIDSASKLGTDASSDASRIVEALRSYVGRKAVDPSSTPDLFGNLSRVFKGRVKAALLFGGRVKGYSMKGDYDIAVYFGRPYDLYELGELLVDIAENLKVDEDEVDVVTLDSVSPEILLEALDGKPIYVEDDYVLFELKVKAFMEMLDIQDVRAKLALYSSNP